MIERNGHTTSLLEIRSFLCAERAALPPWAAPEESLASLYALLVDRRDDTLFWTRLRRLALRLEDRRVDLERMRHSEALGYATMDGLLTDLRADLRAMSPHPAISWKRVLQGSLRATSLAAFLLLGTATASCADDDPAADGGGGSGDTDDTDTALCQEASDQGITGDDGQTYCDLVDIINGASLTGEQRASLLDCLPNLDAAYRESLLEAFDTMSDAQIAAHLEQMLGDGGICYQDTEGGH
jgi:hypothetical protein